MHQDLSYGEILFGQPGARLVKKIFLYTHKSEEKELILKFKTIFRIGFIFLIFITVHELWPVLIFIMMKPTDKKQST